MKNQHRTPGPPACPLGEGAGGRLRKVTQRVGELAVAAQKRPARSLEEVKGRNAEGLG